MCIRDRSNGSSLQVYAFWSLEQRSFASWRLLKQVTRSLLTDHLLQMATLAAEHKPTVLGIPGHVPIPYNLECAIAMLQSLQALFQLLTTGGTLMSCPQASDFAKALGTAARHDNGHIVSLASSLALALRSGRSTLAVAGVFGCLLYTSPSPRDA